MSLWNLIGGFAAMSMMRKWFSGRSDYVSAQPGSEYGSGIRDTSYHARIAELEHQIMESKRRIAEYQKVIDDSRAASGYDDCDVDELQCRIDELENRLYDCDVMSDRYDMIQEEIEILQHRINQIEDSRDDDTYCSEDDDTYSGICQLYDDHHYDYDDHCYDDHQLYDDHHYDDR